MMQVFRVVSAALLAVIVVGHGAGAQPLAQIDGPKEYPPAGFGGNQYVDSAGCVFIRAGLGGQVTWVPRVSRDRKLVCGFDPTFPSEATISDKEATPVASKPVTPPNTVIEPSAPVAPGPAPRPVRLVRVGPIAVGNSYCGSQMPQVQRYLLSDGRRVTQCAQSPAKEPVTYLNALGATGLRVEAGEPSQAEIRRALAADAGTYRIVWSKGPLTAAGKAALSMPARAVSKPGAAASVAPIDARYVQVGAFADPANAERSIARLKALGLPVSTARERKGTLRLRTVLAGPFDDADAVATAVVTLRRNGFAGAFARR